MEQAARFDSIFEQYNLETVIYIYIHGLMRCELQHQIQAPYGI